MKEWKFQWFLDHLPKATRECPYYRTSKLVWEFYESNKAQRCAENYNEWKLKEETK